MKKSRVFSLILVLSILFTCSAYAVVPRASDQIGSYDIFVTPNRGEVVVDFTVEGVGVMSKIGAKKIAIYEDQGGGIWRTVETYNQYDSDMVKTNTSYYGSTIYYSGIRGTKYKVVVTIFAEDFSGVSDSRTETFYVTA